MKVTEEFKNTVRLYLLEKIAEGSQEGLSRYAADTFQISPNTVHTYINELLNEGILQREKRGRYSLVMKETVFSLKRSEGDLDNDTDALETCLEPKIGMLPGNVKSIWRYAFSPVPSI